MGGLQDRLNELADKPEFLEIVEEEVDYRSLEHEKIYASVYQLEKVITKHCGGNDGPTITIKPKDYNKYERAAFAAFLKLQDTWDHALRWKEAERVEDF